MSFCNRVGSWSHSDRLTLTGNEIYGHLHRPTGSSFGFFASLRGFLPVEASVHCRATFLPEYPATAVRGDTHLIGNRYRRPDRHGNARGQKTSRCERGKMNSIESSGSNKMHRNAEARGSLHEFLIGQVLVTPCGTMRPPARFGAVIFSFLCGFLPSNGGTLGGGLSPTFLSVLRWGES